MVEDMAIESLEELEIIDDTPDLKSDIESLRQELQSVVDRLNLNLVSTPVGGLDVHMGTPTAEQMTKINQWLDEPSEADEWFVCCWAASNNLVSRSIRTWHMNVLQQMQNTMPGRPLLLDHNWEEVEDSVGFIFDAQLVVERDAPLSILNKSGYLEENRSIVQDQGYACLYCWTAIHVDMDKVIRGIRSRRLSDCSTGGLLSSVRMICPNCTKQKGREVTFTETDKNDEYVCPHVIPSVWAIAYADDEGIDVQFADYIILDGEFDSIELSIVQAGNLPAASVIR